MRFETHSHSMYSNIRLIDSLNKPEDMITTAADLGYAGIALTDHEALCGHVEWLEQEEILKTKDRIPKDFKCALGNEIYLTQTRELKQRYWHFILIAKNSKGHRALRELSSKAWLNSYTDRRMERVPTLISELVEIVKKYPNSLIADTACLGSMFDYQVLKLAEAEAINNEDEILKWKIEIRDFLKFFTDLFGDDFYIEIAPGTSKEQKIFNRRAKEIAKYYGIKIVIGTDAHYLTSKYREIHKAFLNSKDGEREVDSFYYEAHLMDDEEAFNNIKDIFTREEFEEMCNNSLEIMNKIEGYDLFHSPIIPEVKVYPPEKRIDNNLSPYPTLSRLINSDNPQEREWINQCLISLIEKKIDDKIHYERLELEADILSFISEKLGNCLYSYFNTFRHYIDLFWDCGSIVGPGRGSAGSFLSNYLLGITQLDPVEWGLPYFRFLNKDRAELPDIDVDLAPSKRPTILKKIREERGELNVVQVATFGTTSSKAAITTACRGYRSKEYPKGIDVDIATYLSSLVPCERGKTWTLTECFEGKEEEDKKPVRELINQFDNYPGLKEIAFGIEDIVVRRGQHASGVILYNSSPFETSALMRSPNGDITTQFDLHRSEKLGDVKFDFLVTDICDKLSVALTLLKNDRYFEPNDSLRDIYNKYLHPRVIDLNDSSIWDALEKGNIQDIFQFNTDIGIQTVQTIKPRNPAEMTSANALMRLVAQDGEERPFDRYVKFKNDISLWYKEMDDFGLTKDEQKTLEPYYKRDFGVPSSQEQLMLMVMDPKISNFTLAESNNTRLVLAKKKIKEIPSIKEKFIKQCPSRRLGEYAWKTMMKPQMSYSFSEVHALLYSFIGIQTIIVATKFPSVYWNCACLIVNSQSIEEEDSDLNNSEDEDFDTLEDEEEKDDIEDENEEETGESTKKKKQKTVNYDKIATAIGKMKKIGIVVNPPDINKSSYTFSPDPSASIIRYGLSGIVKVGSEIVQNIIKCRPYSSVDDFLSKVKINKPQMINLIKAGAFDSFGDRVEIMHEYVSKISDTKKRITLQNLKMLIDFGLIPDEYDLERRIFSFNKYLKKMKMDIYYGLDNIALAFFDKNFSLDNLVPTEKTESGFMIKQTVWDKIYKKYMDNIRSYIQRHNQELLLSVNERLTHDVWEKYCLGTLSKWEMDSVSFYSHPHELAGINLNKYNCENFFNMPEEPEIDKVIYIKGKQVPLFKIKRIAGTVVAKDKTKKTVTLLTVDGIVTVKIYGGIFSNYDKQISERGSDGKKHVIRKSEFTRGNKIIVTGIRQGDLFIAKKYSRTPWLLIETIERVNEDGTLVTRGERMEVNE